MFWFRKNLIYFELLLLAWVWASAFVGVRFIANAITPLLAAGIRYIIASLLFLVLLKMKLPKLNHKQWLGVFIAGITGITGYSFSFFIALKYISASQASIFMSITPALSAFASVLLLKEKLNFWGWIGLLIAFAGGILVLNQDTELHFGIGEQLLVIAMFCFVIYGIVGKTLLTNQNPLVISSLVGVIGTMFMIPIIIIEENIATILTLPNYVLLVLIFLGVISTGLGNILFYRGIKEVGVIRTSYYINLIPVFTVLQGYLFLNENLSIQWFIGGSLILFGIFFINYHTYK